MCLVIIPHGRTHPKETGRVQGGGHGEEGGGGGKIWRRRGGQGKADLFVMDERKTFVLAMILKQQKAVRGGYFASPFPLFGTKQNLCFAAFVFRV